MHSAVRSYCIASVINLQHVAFKILSKDYKVAKHHCSFHFQIGWLRCCDAEVLDKSLRRE